MLLLAAHLFLCAGLLDEKGHCSVIQEVKNERQRTILPQIVYNFMDRQSINAIRSHAFIMTQCRHDMDTLK